MKFKENNTETYPSIQEPIIYFLLDKEDVVYVGQSKSGMGRPYQHKDKVFDKISVLKCSEKVLDALETEYIKKYKPKYNKKIGNTHYSLARTKRIIKKNTNIHDFNIYDLNKILKKLDILTYEFKGTDYITSLDFDKIFSFVKNTSDGIFERNIWKNKVFN